MKVWCKWLRLSGLHQRFKGHQVQIRMGPSLPTFVHKSLLNYISRFLFSISACSCLCPIHWSQGVTSRMKAENEDEVGAALTSWQVIPHLHLRDQQFYCLTKQLSACAIRNGTTGLGSVRVNWTTIGISIRIALYQYCGPQCLRVWILLQYSLKHK